MQNNIPPHHVGWVEVEIHSKDGWFLINSQPRSTVNINFHEHKKISSFHFVLSSTIRIPPIINIDERRRVPILDILSDLSDTIHTKISIYNCEMGDCWLLNLVEKWDVDQPDPAVRSPFPSIINIDERRGILFFIINIDDRDGLNSIINIDDRGETITFLLLSILMIGLGHQHLIRVSDLLVTKQNSFHFIVFFWILSTWYSVIEITINGFLSPETSYANAFDKLQHPRVATSILRPRARVDS